MNSRARLDAGRFLIPTIILLVALAVTAAAGPHEWDREISATPRRLLAHSEPVTLGRHTLQFERGAFLFTPSLRFIYPPGGARVISGRTLLSIGAELKPDFAYSDPVRIPGMWLAPERVTTQRSGRTAIEIRTIEIIEGDGTTALIETTAILRGPHESRQFALRQSVADWNALRILYHVRIMMENDAGEIVPIPNLEDDLRTIEWIPAAIRFELKPGRSPGRPPLPADLREAGAGLIVLPEVVPVGETFTALVMFQNHGDLASDSIIATWHYGAVALEETIPAVPPGRTVSCRFTDVARQNEDRVEFRIDNRLLTAEFTPMTYPLLTILSARVEEKYADEAMTIHLAIENRGLGVAAAPLLRLDDARGRETTVTLPALLPGDKTSLTVLWNDAPADSFFLSLCLLSGTGDETGLVIPVDRPPRPTARIAIERLAVTSSGVIGGPMTLVATITNSGTIEGLAALKLDAVHLTSGETLLEHSWTGRIPAAGRIEVASEVIPQEPGLLRGHARLGDGLEEFVITDLPPLAAPEREGRILRPMRRADQPAGNRIVRRIEHAMAWSAEPLVDPSEIDSSPFLSLSLLAWKRTVGGVWTAVQSRENRPVARLTVTGNGDRERFDVTAGETAFALPLSKRLLADTVLLQIEPINDAVAFLLGPPTLVLTPAAFEHGAILDVSHRGGAIQVRIANRGRLIEAPTVTLAADVDNAEYLRLALPLAPGEETTVQLPVPPRAAGRHAVTLSLPRSVNPAGPTLSVLVPPDPLPELWAGIPCWGTMSGGGDFLILPVEVAIADAPGLIVEALSAAGAPIAAIRAQLAVPAGETAIFLLPPAARLRLDYGPMTIERPVPPRPTATSRHRLLALDLGGDSAVPDREIVLRYERRGDGAIPAGMVKLVVNGLLRAAQNVPALETGQVHIAGFSFFPGPSEENRLDVILFEELSESHLLLSLFTAPYVAGASGPTRADRGWTAPLLLDARARPAAETGSIYLGLAERAWEAGAFLMRRTDATLPPITPETARRLDALAAETSAMARIAYREELDAFLDQWRSAAVLLSGVRLPVTVETRHVEALFHALDELETIVIDPAVVERGHVEAVLGRMARALDFILGRDVERK